MKRIIVFLLFFGAVGCTGSQENNLNFVVSDSNKSLIHARMENIEVIFDNESTTHGMSSYELALAHFNLFKFGPSIKQNGLSLDVTESELKSHGNSKR